ncbi:MAG: hypothetical protein WCL06_08505 [Bacteroidota bacterium]
MKPNKVFTSLLLLFGEAIIIFCFLHFAKGLSTEILVLNTVVTSLIYLLYFIDKLIPMVDLKDKSHREVGAMGVKWVYATIYMVLAVSVMIFFNGIHPIDFTSQLIIHGALFFVLLLGVYFSSYSSRKAHSIYVEENQQRSVLIEIKTTIRDVLLKLEKASDAPPEIAKRIIVLQDNLRYISPSNNKEALEFETQILKEMKAIYGNLFDIPINVEKIVANIVSCEIIYKERKKIFSN